MKNLNISKAFELFSPYKQKEFIEYIDTAKQEKTKLDRLEKIKPMILDGKGLNDK
ncbi:YdeI/OmpD-associated family protein [Flavobacterium sp.]|uniref:YdeI/OmpD-associated family protein n=1 Tax=Flavobacterium sp. TaxID=239 RepID=UPI003752B62E